MGVSSRPRSSPGRPAGATVPSRSCRRGAMARAHRRC